MPRLKNLDCLKAAAMLAIVFLHYPPTAVTMTTAWQLLNQFCRFAVPCFFLVSGFFFARSFLRAPDGRNVIARYGSRLLILFLIWAIFYAVVPPFEHPSPPPATQAREHLEYIARHPKFFLLSGYVFHLWFLSALLQGICVVGLSLCCNRLWLGIASGGVLFGLALAGGPYAQVVGWKWHFDMKLGPLFSTLFVALGAAATVYQWRLSVRASTTLALAGLFLEWVEDWALRDPAHGVTLASHDFTLGTLPFAAGIFFLLLALPDRGPGWLAKIGTYSLGIFVLHIYVLRVLTRLAVWPTLLNLPPVLLVAVFGLALATSMALARLPYARRLVT